MTLSQAYKDFELKYVEVDTKHETLSSEDVTFYGEETTIEDLVRDYPLAEGRIDFDMTKGGFTFKGRN